MIRVTDTTMALTVQRALQSSQSALGAVQTRLSSGKRIQAWSDSPADATSVARLRSEQREWDAYTKAADDGEAWLGTADSALQNAVDLLHRARELTTAAASSILAPSEREAIAVELESIRDELVGLANTTHLDNPVFAGHGTAAVQQVGGVWTYTGDAGQVQRRVAPEVMVTVNVSANDVFGFAAGNDVFSLLDQVAADVRAGNVAAVGGSHLTDLTARTHDLTSGLATIGARTNQITHARQTGAERLDVIRTNRTSLEDVDFAQAAVDLTMARSAYEAALAATAQLSLPSLARFLG